MRRGYILLLLSLGEGASRQETGTVYVGLSTRQGGLFCRLQCLAHALELAAQRRARLQLVGDAQLPRGFPRGISARSMVEAADVVAINFTTETLPPPPVNVFVTHYLPGRFLSGSSERGVRLAHAMFRHVALPEARLRPLLGPRFAAFQFRVAPDWFVVNSPFEPAYRGDYLAYFTRAATKLASIIEAHTDDARSAVFIAGREADAFRVFASRNNLTARRLATKSDLVDTDHMSLDERALFEFAVCRASHRFSGNLYSAFYITVAQSRRAAGLSSAAYTATGLLRPTTPAQEYAAAAEIYEHTRGRGTVATAEPTDFEYRV